MKDKTEWFMANYSTEDKIIAEVERRVSYSGVSTAIKILDIIFSQGEDMEEHFRPGTKMTTASTRLTTNPKELIEFIFHELYNDL